MNAPDFLHRNPDIIISELVSEYEARTGKVLQPAQIERLIFQSWAYRETLVRNAIQDAATQNLVDFARAPMLDHIGRLVGVNRLAAVNATVRIEFTLISAHAGVIIPRGTRVSSRDGTVIFATMYELPVAAGVTSGEVDAEALTAGAIGSGYLIGQVTAILDPQAFIVSASNTNASGGGADQENDEALRERIRLAPASFSNAGSRGAYLFWTKTANAGIIDAAILNPVAGTVAVYPLMEDGEITPSQVIGQVEQTLNDEKIRPLTDTVIIASPTRLTYDIRVDVVILNIAVQSDVEAAIETNLNAFVLGKRKKLGQDVTESQVIAQCMVPGVYSAALLNWTDIVADEEEFAVCTGIIVVTTGTNPG